MTAACGGSRRGRARTRRRTRWYRKRGFEESERYLHVYARGREELGRAVTAEAGLMGVHAFLHMVDMGREAEMRASFARVYVCRCYERPL